MSESLIRCAWASNPLSIRYHDEEWGVPVHDDRTLFEFLILEGAQAGLSWDTILKKRESYRAAFHNFDPVVVSSYSEADISAFCAEYRNHSQPPEGQRSHRQCARVSGSAAGVRNIR